MLLDLRDWGVLRLEGPDALEFLQGVATQDLAALEPGRALQTLFLSEKGRPIALAWVARDAGGAFRLFVEPGGRDALPGHFDRLRVMEEVSIVGPGGMPALFAAAGSDRDAAAHAWAGAHAGAEAIAGDPLTFLVPPPGGAAPAPSTLASSEEREAWRIAVGIPRAGVDFDEQRIATELSLDAAISLTKGCYVGQEVVARTTHRGAVRRRRIGFRYPGRAGVLPRGTPLRAGGVAAGHVTSSTLEPGTGRGLGMGFLSAEALENPVEVLAIQDTVTTHLEVAPWPL